MDINLTAPLNTLGYGTAGRGLLRGLLEAGHDVALWPLGPVEVEDDEAAHVERCRARQGSFSDDAPSVRLWHQFDLAHHVGRGPRVAFTIFELDAFRTDELHHLAAQDLVVTPSAWGAGVLARSGACRAVAAAPLGVRADVFDRRLYPPRAGGPTVFLSSGKWELRKGHDLLVRAFNAAFTPADDVLLLMHAYNPCFADPGRGAAYNRGWSECYRNSPMGRAGKIRLTEGRFASSRQVAAWMAQADCGVFLSRAEGWDLGATEMLALGRPVILTDYSAHTEFSGRSGCLRVEVDALEDAHDGVWFRADDRRWPAAPGRWARLGERQLEQAVAHLRAVHRAKASGQTPAVSEESITWRSCAEHLVDAIRRLSGPRAAVVA